MSTCENHFKKILLLLAFLTTSLILSPVSFASEEADATSFTYNVVFPDNQMKKDIGYYHLKMSPSQEQTLQIELSNPGKEKTTVDISINGAKTNSNGVIEYGENNIRNDKSLKYEFKDVVTAPDKVTLNPGESKQVDIKIKMPETSYDGVLAGGIQLIQEGQADSKENKGAMVINEYAYVIGMLLQETDKEVKPALEFNQVRVGQSNYKNSVYIDYSNKEAQFVNNMTTEVQISKKGENLVKYEHKQSAMRMAPNSFIAFSVSMNGERMEAGDYTAHILVTADDGIKEEWTKDFTITKDEADKFNERDVGLVQEKGFDWKLITLIVVIFFVLVAGISYWVASTRKKKTTKKKKRR